MQRQRGLVKFWKGSYGFIIPDRDQADEVFVHQSRITMDGYRELLPEQTVEFSGQDGARGVQAVDVVPLDDGGCKAAAAAAGG